MLFRNSPEKFFNMVAARYAESPIPDMAAYDNKIGTLSAYLSPGQHVLDIGCGTGTQCGDLSKYVQQVTGIDISSKLLAIAEQRKAERHINNVEFIQTTMFDERFKPGSFDVVMAFYVLHFIEDIDVAISRIHSLLKPNGTFILETACMGDSHPFMGKIIRVAGKLGFLPLINPLTTQKIEQALVKVGFSVEKKERFREPDGEYTLIARKQ